ncbi:MAG: hypothetical protein F6K63_00510 [Moorea sp. SIO1G6]|uniref:Uncharacterized protein n=1 Tax=Moorena producens (strain JHB) TaxID=1454205 RepID=A0A1D9G1B1_MOOP1|nr:MULTISPECIES: hypothetical protein [Moorena]AOY81412.2 hypothetical protein BJP36_17355 [Moorena producens JHB]NES83606.1 hypothetical protein [Moorena sp. SIO2B7]NET62957.1 hypothetical protein [Moorena sp. SIO1G6]
MAFWPRLQVAGSNLQVVNPLFPVPCSLFPVPCSLNSESLSSYPTRDANSEQPVNFQLVNLQLVNLQLVNLQLVNLQLVNLQPVNLKQTFAPQWRDSRNLYSYLKLHTTRLVLTTNYCINQFGTRELIQEE